MKEDIDNLNEKQRKSSTQPKKRKLSSLRDFTKDEPTYINKSIQADDQEIDNEKRLKFKWFFLQILYSKQE